MGQTTELDEAPHRGTTEATPRRALVMVFPVQVAVDLPAQRVPLGRAWIAGLGVAGGRVSNRHLQFHTQGSTVGVEDLQSKNGTFVDGVRLAPGERCSLREGAVLRVGPAVFVYRSRFVGAATPSDPIGGLVGPFGLRPLAAQLSDLERVVGARAAPILIQAESGAGKELLAEALAKRLRARGKAIRVNAAAVPGTTFESYLFGHARGAFTDAKVESLGVFREHDGGTVVLDELGELPLELQPKLLRMLDSGEVQPVGGRGGKVDVLVIASTNRPLEEAVAAGRFRRDLLERFAWRLSLPPLRERAEDVLAIAAAMAQRQRGVALDPAAIDALAVEVLLTCPWSAGNARELWRCLELAATRAPPGALTLEAVNHALDQMPSSRPSRASGSFTEAQLNAALRETGGNQSEAAKLLGVGRGSVTRRLQRKKPG